MLAGYVFGSGILIVASQLAGLTGIDVDTDPYLSDVGAVLRNLDLLSVASLTFGLATIVVVVVMKRFARDELAASGIEPRLAGIHLEVGDAVAARLADHAPPPAARPGEARDD